MAHLWNISLLTLNNMYMNFPGSQRSYSTDSSYRRYGNRNMVNAGYRALDFNSYASEGNRLVNEVSDELGVDRNSAARVLRAVLHAIRDRIPPDDAIQFAQGLPMALKGVFIDRYDLSDAPVVIRGVDEFLDYIYYKDGSAAPYDFTSRDSVIYALQAVFRVLKRNMDYGQVMQVKNMLNLEIQEIIE